MKTLSGILDESIDLCLRNRKDGLKQSMTLEDWYREMATIKLNFPRRSGKTTAIDEVCSGNDIVIVRHPFLIKSYKYAKTVLTPYMIENGYLSGRDLRNNIIFIDEPNQYDIKFLKELYICGPRLIVMVGTE